MAIDNTLLNKRIENDVALAEMRETVHRIGGKEMRELKKTLKYIRRIEIEGEDKDGDHIKAAMSVEDYRQDIQEQLMILKA